MLLLAVIGLCIPAIFIVSKVSSDGECNWLEGVQLMTVYFIIAIAFFII